MKKDERNVVAADKRKRMEYIALDRRTEERAEGLTIEEIIDTTTKNKAAIVGAVTRYSNNRVQFNNNVRNIVLKSVEIIDDLMVWLAFKQSVNILLERENSGNER